MLIHLNDLTVGAIVDSEDGQLKVVSHYSDEKKTYLELEKINDIQDI